MSFSLFFFFMKNMSLVLLLEAFAFMSDSDYVCFPKISYTALVIWYASDYYESLQKDTPLFILKGFYMDFLPCCLWWIYFRKLFHRRWLTGSFPKYTSGFIFTSLHKKWSFPLRISSFSCGFSHICWRNC